MAHFAKVENQIVVDVIVAEQELIDSGAVGTGWIQTSYNTQGGIHYGADGKPDGGHALRKNFAGIGYHYDPDNDAFYAPRPYPSWQLDTKTFLWNAPKPYPQDGQTYFWDEDSHDWQEVGQ